MTMQDIIGYGVEFAIRAGILLAALWGMIKLQKLNYNVLGLVASAGLTSGLDMALEHFIGGFGTPIVIIVLVLCITKVTGGDHVDVGFTIAVSYALVFCVNMWLLGMMLGDLRVSARESREEAEELAYTQMTNDLAKAKASAVPTNAPADLHEETPIEDSFVLKGVTQSRTTPLALIQAGKKTYTVTIGESFQADTPKGKVTVTCKSIADDRVLLDVSGETVTLSFLSAAK
jgi:hypothetical protein